MPPGYRLILRLPECRSTQDFLKKSSLPGWSVVWADRQGSGRGRQGRSWESPSGGLYYSFRYPCEILERDPALQVLGAACVWLVLLESRTEAEIEFSLKWPNDLLCNGRKIGGFLAEKKEGWLNLGAGINVNNEFGPDLSEYRRTPISLREATGDEFSLPELLLNWLDLFTGALKRGSDRYLGRRALQERVDTIGREIEVEGKVGRAVGLDETGALLVDFDGRAELIFSGDVQEVQYH